VQSRYLEYTSPERDRYWVSALNPTINKGPILGVLCTDTRPLLEIRPTQNPTVVGPVPSVFYTDTLPVWGVYMSDRPVYSVYSCDNGVVPK
jgi:hypothetical protein